MTRLEGIITPMVTPLTANGRLDVNGLEHLIEHLISGGVAGLFPLGTTGEGPMFPLEMQTAVCREVVRINAGRLPVLTGISSASPLDSLELGRRAADSGAAAVVAAPPCYLPLTDDEIFDFYATLADAIKIPVIIYNMPAATKIKLPVELIVRIAEIPNIIGCKDSSGDMDSFQKLLFLFNDRRPDFSVFMGPDALMAQAVASGASGGVNSGSNLYPRIYVNCYQAAHSGDFEAMRYWQTRIMMIQRLYALRQPITSGVTAAMKAGLENCGICGGAMCAPLKPVSEKETAAVAALMSDISGSQPFNTLTY